MIHNDVRLIGLILGKLTNGVVEVRYRKQYIKDQKKVGKIKPKKARMEKIYLKHSDESDMCVVILKPEHEVTYVPAILWLHG